MYKPKYWTGYARSLGSGLRAGYRYAPIAKFIYNRTRSGVIPRRVIKSRRKLVVRRPYRKRRYKKSSVKKLTSKVSKLKKQVESNMSTYIKKERFYRDCLVANDGECNYTLKSFNYTTGLDAAIDAVKYFDPSVPGTLINVDMSVPTFQQQILFEKNYAKMLVRNNYSVPARVTLYLLHNKFDTSITPTTSISNSLTDMSNATITDSMVYPTDCHDFNDTWRIAKSKTDTLQVGGELSLSYASPSFKYDISLVDSHTSVYQKHFHACVLMVRVEGVPSHGQTSGVSQAKAGVDVFFDMIHRVKYPGGADLKYLEIVNSPDAITGNDVVSEWQHEQAQYAK